jgi:PTH1 family peptidyl-tRNA hydrolase
MQLVVGLGNPGSKYAGNRHNIGFMAVDEIVRRHGFSAWRRRFQGETAEATIAGDKVLILKPATYMNESGRSVGEAMRFFNLEPTDVTVFHDEIDLAPGKVRSSAAAMPATTASAPSRRISGRIIAGCGSASGIPATRTW